MLLVSILPIIPIRATQQYDWSKARPTDDRTFDDTVTGTAADDKAALTMAVGVGKYTAADQGFPDHVHLSLDISATTRGGIRYGWELAQYGYYWVNGGESVGITSENSTVKLDLGFPVLFYGIVYNSVWVYSNGFVSFTSGDYSATPPPSLLPDSSINATIVAPFWRLLKPGVGASIITTHVHHWLGDNDNWWYQVITWSGMLDRNNQAQTFQLLIQDHSCLGWQYDCESKFYFQYQSITTELPTVIGVQDRIGQHGSFKPVNQVSSGSYGGMSAAGSPGEDQGYRLNSLKFTAVKSDSWASVEPQSTLERGWNVALNGSGTTEIPETLPILIKFAAQSLIKDYAIGLAMGGLFVLFDLFGAAAASQYVPASGTLIESTQSTNEASGMVCCSPGNPEEDGSFMVTGERFDLSFSDGIVWYLFDTCSADHTLTLTATATYTDSAGNGGSISTSVVLNMYHGYHYLDVGSRTITPSEPIDGACIKVDGETHRTPFSLIVSESDHTIEAVSPTLMNDGQEYTFVSWMNHPELDRIFTMHVDADVYGQQNPLYAEYYLSQEPGGCPYVYVWNGTGYVKDNNVLPASEAGNGTDVKDFYRLEQPLTPCFTFGGNSLYSLQIGEFESEYDHIDEVTLASVDHAVGTGVAVTPEGQILTYASPAAPLSCVDNNGVDQSGRIGTMDGNVSDPFTYYQGDKGDWLVMNFGRLTGPAANLLLRDDMLCDKVCLEVQVQNENGAWLTVETLHPRAYWGIEAANMTAYLPSDRDFMVRLLWTATHRVDFVGLDTSAQASVTVNTAAPVLAIHSNMGPVTAKLLYDDENCVELVNGQELTLFFVLSSDAESATRDFIFYVNGYYYTKTP